MISKHVVIVGGGISGLSAAWYLQNQAQAQGIELNCTVLEATNRWGGKIQTEQIDGFARQPFVIEGGPDSFLTQKPWALQLARALGLEDRLLGTNDHARHVYVLNKGKPVLLPDGVLLIVPTKFMPFAVSPLISPLGKLRMGLDWFIPPKTDDLDETLADFVRRRLGNEALDKIAEPLMSGIYNAEADRQSILATFPRFRQLEKEHGSLIRGMLASRRKQPSAASTNHQISTFMSLRDGTQELITALLSKLTGDLRANCRVTQIEPTLSETYTLHLNNSETIDADAVIFTTPAFITSELLRPIAPDAAKKLASIRYVSTGTISLAFHHSDVQRPLNGFGLVIPQSEQRPINAITLSSTKFDHRAPEGFVLLRVFFGGSRSPESMALDDDELLHVVRQELRAILGIEAVPLFHRIYRWFNANPQYDLGHLERVAAIEASLLPNIYVTGSAYRGVGMPDCVYQSQQIAQKVITELTEREISQ